MADGQQSNVFRSQVHKDKDGQLKLVFTRPAAFVSIKVSTPLNEETFVIHRDLIGFHSPFFRAAFTHNFIEGRTQTVALDDVDVESFGRLVHWLYTYDVHLENCTEAEPDEKREAEVNDSNIMPLTHLWILAGRFLMPDLQSNVVAALNYVLVTCKLEDEGLDRLVEFVNFIYEHLPAEANPLKQLALRRFFGQGVRGDMKAWQGRLPKDFLSESISWMEVNKPVEVKESRGPVEFNVAIRFVDKIKTRFPDDVYRQFLDILQTYLRDPTPAQDVHARIALLFNNAPDLLEDFEKFFPNPASQASTRAAAQVTEDA